MTQDFQIIIPIQGTSTFFPLEKYFYPKPLVEVNGKTIIETVINNLKKQFEGATFHFVIDEYLAKKFSFHTTLKLLAGNAAKIIIKQRETKGALCSVLLLSDEIDFGKPVLICNSDHCIERYARNLIQGFVKNSVDAGTLTFQSSHPRWSYVLTDDHGNFLQAFEKKVVSDKAIAGIYYFQSFKLFFDAAANVLRNAQHHEGDYFISETLNEIFLAGGAVQTAAIPPGFNFSFYSPRKIEEYENIKHKTVPELSKDKITLIVPAAGAGSRFSKEKWQKPKPFIDVGGLPMLVRVIQNVRPQNSKVVTLLRSEHMSLVPDEIALIEDQKAKIIEVTELTEGTACTILLAQEHIDVEKPLLIANSDQLVELDTNAVIDDCLVRGLDGSIVVFRDKNKDPKWSFAKVDEDGLITQVAEKNPISELATVGIYFFAKGIDFLQGAISMIAKNERVNGEFYTCPIYNHLIAGGKKIGVYEIDRSDMHGLGIPEDLHAYIEKFGLSKSKDAPLNY